MDMLMTVTTLLFLASVVRVSSEISQASFLEAVTAMANHNESEIPFNSGYLTLVLDENKVEDGTVQEVLDQGIVRVFRTRFATNMSKVIGCKDEDEVAVDPMANRVWTHPGSSFGKCFWVYPFSKVNLDNLEVTKPKVADKVYLLDHDQEAGLVSVFNAKTEGSCNCQLVIDIVEKWSGGQKVYVSEESFWERRRDLRGIEFLSAIFEFPPYTVIPGGDISQSHGFYIDLLNSLSQALNFTYKLRIPPSGNFGQLNPNGSWDGVVGMCQRREIDFSTSLIKVTRERAMVVDFSSVVTSHRNVIVTRQGTKFAVRNEISSINHRRLWRWNLYLQRHALISMFTEEVLLVIVVLVLGLISMAVLVVWVLSREDFNLSYTIMTTYGLVALQGCDEKFFRCLPMRFLCYSGLLMGFLVMNSFSARLTSHLSVKFSPGKIDSLEEVEEQGLELFMLGGTASVDIYAEAPLGSVERNLFDNQISKDKKFTPYTTEMVIDNFLASPRAAMEINPRQILHWIYSHTDIGCSLDMLPRTVEIKLAMPFRRDFAYAEVFSYQLMKMRESGLMDRLMQKWVYPVDKSLEFMCSKGSSEHSEGVDFRSISGLFVFLGCGSVLGICFLGLEHLCKRANNVRSSS